MEERVPPKKRRAFALPVDPSLSMPDGACRRAACRRAFVEGVADNEQSFTPPPGCALDDAPPALRTLLSQGVPEDGAGMGAGLNGGAFFELPGCISTFAYPATNELGANTVGGQTAYALGGTCGRGGAHGEGQQRQ